MVAVLLFIMGTILAVETVGRKNRLEVQFKILHLRNQQNFSKYFSHLLLSRRVFLKITYLLRH